MVELIRHVFGMPAPDAKKPPEGGSIVVDKAAEAARLVRIRLAGLALGVFLGLQAAFKLMG